MSSKEFKRGAAPKKGKGAFDKKGAKGGKSQRVNFEEYLQIEGDIKKGIEKG